MGSRGRRRGSQNRAQDRVRNRVRGGGSRRGGGGTSRRQGGFDLGDVDVGAIQNYAGRLKGRGVGSSGLAGAAAGLAGGGLAGRLLGGSEEGLRTEVAENFALVEERLQLLEDQVQELRGMLGAEDPAGETDPGGVT